MPGPRAATAIGLTALVLAGAAWIAVARDQRAAAAHPGELHTFLHINCWHHSHGPKGHQNHGRTLGAKRGGEEP